jgi:phage baseplate assembly protein W
MDIREPIGFPFLPMPGADGSLPYPPNLDASVRQSLRIILSTRPGELLQHAEFGAGLDTLLHEPNTLSLRRDVQDRIKDSLAQWEPRIDVDRVDVNEVVDDPTAIRVEIVYRLRRTGVQSAFGLTLDTAT